MGVGFFLSEVFGYEEATSIRGKSLYCPDLMDPELLLFAHTLISQCDV